MARAKAGELSPAIEAMLWHYAFGKPKEHLEHSGPSGGVIPVDLNGLTRDELTARAEALVRRLRGETP